MESEVGTIKHVVSPHTCGLCALWNHPSEFYATCLVFASKNLIGTTPRLIKAPFWRCVTGMSVVRDMTTRTFSSEGKECDAYIKLESEAA